MTPDERRRAWLEETIDGKVVYWAGNSASLRRLTKDVAALLDAPLKELEEALEGTINFWIDGKACWCPFRPKSDARVIPHAACLDARTALARLPWRETRRKA